MKLGVRGIGIAVLLAGTVSFAQSGRKITGVVVAAATQRPVANAQVQYEEIGRATQTTVTDSKGRFEIPSGAEGVVTVSARSFGTARRAWPPRMGRELQFALVPPSGVDGTLADMATGRAVEGIVTLSVRHPVNLVSDAKRAAGGTFRFDDLPPGPAVILAHADGYAPYFGELTIDTGKRSDARVRLLLEAAASGSVLDAGGSAVAGARVRVGYAYTLPGHDLLAGVARGHAVTESDGAFRIGGLVPDTPIGVQAELAGRRSDVVTVTVGPGMEQPNIVLRLP